MIKITGKFTPIHQWLHYECGEILQEQLTSQNSNPCQSSIEMVLGPIYLDLLKNIRVFLVIISIF